MWCHHFNSAHGGPKGRGGIAAPVNRTDYDEKNPSVSARRHSSPSLASKGQSAINGESTASWGGAASVEEGLEAVLCSQLHSPAGCVHVEYSQQRNLRGVDPSAQSLVIADQPKQAGVLHPSDHSPMAVQQV